MRTISQLKARKFIGKSVKIIIDVNKVVDVSLDFNCCRRPPSGRCGPRQQHKIANLMISINVQSDAWCPAPSNAPPSIAALQRFGLTLPLDSALNYVFICRLPLTGNCDIRTEVKSINGRRSTRSVEHLHSRATFRTHPPSQLPATAETSYTNCKTKIKKLYHIYETSTVRKIEKKKKIRKYWTRNWKKKRKENCFSIKKFFAAACRQIWHSICPQDSSQSDSVWVREGEEDRECKSVQKEHLLKVNTAS